MLAFLIMSGLGGVLAAGLVMPAVATTSVVTDTSVRAKLRLPDRPEGEASSWPLRFSDFDGLAHVNNAAYWLPAEEHLAGRRSAQELRSAPKICGKRSPT